MKSFKGKRNTDVKERFWSKVSIKSPNECWNYRGYKDRDGYGNFWTRDTYIKAHRFAYELHYKCKIPAEKLILHNCDNPSCCNPYHLRIGTQSDNLRDRSIRNKVYSKKCMNNAKLTEENVKRAIKLYNTSSYSYAKLGRIFEVSGEVMSRAIRGITKHRRIYAKA